MPRDTESIRHPLHERITETTLWGGFRGRDVWNVYPNSFGVPAGRNRGRFADKQALLRVQERYWKKGLPMGMELELELPSQYDHGGDNYVYMRDYEPVKEVMELVNKKVIDGMRNFALRNGQDWYHWSHTVSAKGDGSLHNGVEFNFQPFTTNAFKKYAASTFQDIGYTKFQRMADNAGIHIHIPKAAFSDVELYMWLLLIQSLNSAKHTNGSTFIETIGQRGTRTYSHDNDLLTGDRLYNAVINRRWSQGKYRQINFNGHGNTMEFRIFASNQMPERLIKNMAFAEHTWRYVHLLMDFINDEKYTQALQFLADANMFAGYIRNPNMKGHNDELASFVKRRWKPSSTNGWQFDDTVLPNLVRLNEQFQNWNNSESINNNITTNTEEVAQ